MAITGELEIQIVSEQVQRLAGLRDYPRFEPVAIRELETAFLKANDTMEVARIVGDIVRSEGNCPRPADVYRIIGEAHAKPFEFPQAVEEPARTPEQRAQRELQKRELAAHQRALDARMAEIAADPKTKFQYTTLAADLKAANQRLREAW